VTGVIDRARALLPSWPQVERYWLGLDDATPLVVVRTFYGLVTLLWTASLVPDLELIFFEDGLRPERRFGSGRFLTLFRWVSFDALFVVATVLLLASAALVVAGRWVRVTVPVTAVLHMWLIDASRPWGIGAERTLVLGALYLAVFHALTPRQQLGHFADATGSRGVTPQWGLRLMQLQLAIGYLATSLSKLGGGDWLDGSAVYHAIEADQLQRFEPPPWLTDHPLPIHLMTYGALLVELALAPLLLWPRTRRWGVLLAIGLHVSFELFLELGFFAMAMTVLILSFAPASDLRRVLDRIPWPRGGQVRHRQATVTP
jgi:hypothetical protein